MESTPEQRLFEIHQSYQIADQRKAQDWKDATTKAQAQKIADNVSALHASYLQAALVALNGNSAAIEAAYQAAKAARTATEAAYNEAKALPERINLVGSMVKSVGNLLKNLKDA